MLIKFSCKQIISFFSRGLNRFSLAVLAFCMTRFAFAGDLLTGPASDLFETFKGTGIKLIILAEIITAMILYAKSKNLAVFIGLPIVLLITSWAKTQF